MKYWTVYTTPHRWGYHERFSQPARLRISTFDKNRADIAAERFRKKFATGEVYIYENETGTLTIEIMNIIAKTLFKSDRSNLAFFVPFGDYRHDLMHKYYKADVRDKHLIFNPDVMAAFLYEYMVKRQTEGDTKGLDQFLAVIDKIDKKYNLDLTEQFMLMTLKK